MLQFIQFPVEEEHFDAAMVSVSAQEVMRLDVVSYQTIQGRVGMEIHTVVIVRCDVPGDQGRIHATL